MKDIERMVISAYEDGEVDAPWNQRIARRLAEDADWATEADGHRKIKAALAASPEPDFSEARRRVKARIEAGLPLRTRTLPLAWISVAAAAVLVLAGGGGFWLGRQTVPAAPSAVAELQVQVPKTLGLKLSGEGQLLMASTLQGKSR